MEERYLLKPDREFIEDVTRSGGESLKKCFQCSTCTVVCALSPDDRPFPRKEMIWAQWGLKDKLVSDPDIWMCHQCTDCSDQCPRNAKPADVFAAIRNYTIRYFSRPQFLAKAFSSPKYLPYVLVIPALIMLAYFWAFTGFNIPEGTISPEDYFPSAYTYAAMGILFGFMFLFVGIGLYRFWKSLGMSGASTKRGGLASLILVVIDIIKHSKFGKCDTNSISRYSHLAIFYGAILLMIATALSASFHHFLHIYSPHALLSPVKIAGNLGAVLVLGGLLLVIIRRLSANSSLGTTSYSDWFLVWMFLIATVSGIATELIRLAGLAEATYWTYFIHLWSMFVFFIALPFSKAAHMFYRTIALTYAKQIGREVV
jgi:quinone-modifying oxidoreductase subunit QmoC